MKNIQFTASVFSLNQLPAERLPEVLLCGRSNVGKSSFLNTLAGRKLAKVSATPGKTRSLNYFKTDDRFYIVDLPGFGYAKVDKAERARWEKLLQDFFSRSGYIVGAVHLVDSRHEPTPLDFQMKEIFAYYRIPVLAALTKIDKLPRSQRSGALKNLGSLYHGATLGENAFLFSSVTGEGKSEAGRLIQTLAAAGPPAGRM